MNAIEILTTMPLTALGGVMLIGMILCRLALRGRRVNDHPVCRRCGYDLFGRPAGSDVCSECGASLTRKRAVRRGQRQIHRVFFLLGLILTLTGGGFLVDRAVVFTRTADPWQYKPVWLLEREADKSDPHIADQAIGELLRRARGGSLSQARAASIAEHALTVQGNRSRRWTPLWGDLVETLHAGGLLSQVQWGRYSQKAIKLRLRVRPRVRRGDVIPIIIEYDVPRESSDPTLFYSMENLYFQIAGQHVRLPSHQSWSEDSKCFHVYEKAAPAYFGKLHLSPQEWESVAAGKQTITCKYTLTSFPNSDGVYDHGNNWERKDLTSPPISTVEGEFSTTLEILNEDQSSNERVYDPAREAEMIAALKPSEIVADELNSHRFDLVIAEHTVPIAVSFNVYLEVDKNRWQAFLQLTQGANETWVMSKPNTYHGLFGATHFEKVDVVLEPDSSDISESFDCWPIWGHAIRYKDVPIRWLADDRDKTQPTTRPQQ